MITKRRRLFFDIETSPNVGLFWSAGYKQRIDHSNIIKERAIICICYKWEDEKDVFSLKWNGKHCDKKLLQDFIQIANLSDELIGHNGDKFDLAWIRTRCAHHRIEMFPTYRTIDTLKISRSKFKFNSNRLDYIASFLGIGQKIKTEFALWKDIVLNSSKPAMEQMIKYCKHDVVLLEKVFSVLRGHIEPKTHFGVVFGEDRGSCPECGAGSKDLIIQNRRTMASGLRKIQYKCKVCHRMHSKTDK